MIYRVAQEALTNALRHSRATRISIRLDSDRDQVVLSVRDNGLGSPARLEEGTGIAGMRERALLIGAALELVGADAARPRGPPHGAGTQRADAVTTPLRTRVMLADDHELVRSGLRLVLDAQPDIKVVSEASDGAEAVQKGLADEIDLAVIDVSMPRLTGLQAAAELRRRRPGLRVLLLSMHDNEQYFFAALKAERRDTS